MTIARGNRRTITPRTLLFGLCLALCSSPAWSFYDDGKVLLTGGVGMIDGAGGGGITPWATIAGYGTRDGINEAEAPQVVKVVELQPGVQVPKVPPRGTL